MTGGTETNRRARPWDGGLGEAFFLDGDTICFLVSENMWLSAPKIASKLKFGLEHGLEVRWNVDKGR